MMLNSVRSIRSLMIRYEIGFVAVLVLNIVVRTHRIEKYVMIVCLN